MGGGARAPPPLTRCDCAVESEAAPGQRQHPGAAGPAHRSHDARRRCQRTARDDQRGPPGSGQRWRDEGGAVPQRWDCLLSAVPLLSCPPTAVFSMQPRGRQWAGLWAGPCVAVAPPAVWPCVEEAVAAERFQAEERPAEDWSEVGAASRDPRHMACAALTRVFDRTRGHARPRRIRWSRAGPWAGPRQTRRDPGTTGQPAGCLHVQDQRSPGR